MKKLLITLTCTALVGCAAPTVKEIESAAPDKTEIVNQNYEKLARCVAHQMDGEQAYGLFAKPPRADLRTFPDMGEAEIVRSLGEGAILAIYNFKKMDQEKTQVTMFAPKTHGSTVVLSGVNIDKFYEPVTLCK